MLLFLVTPSVIVMVMLFRGEDVLGFPPRSWSLRWYARPILTARPGSTQLGSAKIAVMSTALALLLGTTAAYGLVRGPRWLRNAGYALLLAPLMVPSVVMARSACSASWRAGVCWGPCQASCWPTRRSASLTSRHDADGARRRLELASMSLGASHLRTATRVILPLIMPGIVAVGVFRLHQFLR